MAGKKGMDYKIAKMTPAQAQLAWLWAKEEGWNPGLEDHILLPRIDPDGCLALTTPNPDNTSEDLMIGSITAVDYGGYGFGGMLIIDKNYRCRGLGKMLLDLLMKKLKSIPNSGGDGVQHMVPYYRTIGFVPAYDIPRYRLPRGTKLPTKYAADFKGSDFEEVASYDSEVFQVPRGNFLKGWISSKHADTAVVRRNGKIAGFGVVRDCYVGRKIGPLFADNIEYAEDVLGLLLSKKKDLCHFIDVPVPTPDGKRLVEKAEVVFVCTRMYTGTSPQQDVKKVYGNTTFEMG